MTVDLGVFEPRVPVVFKPAWRRADAAIERDVTAFWAAENILPRDTDPAQRLSELCMAGYVGEQLAAVSTAVIRDVDFLGCKLAMFRCSVGQAWKRNYLALAIQAHSRELLEEWSLANPDEAVMGMGTVTQTRVAQDRAVIPAVFPAAHLHFIGWTANNEPMRVAWFAHATVPERPGAIRG
jgi:hypothetical protein